MSFIDALLNVLAIIGIIIAGGFLVFFLGDLLLSILEPRHKTFYKVNKYEKDDFYEKPIEHENQPKFSMDNEPVSQISEEKFVMDDEEVRPVNLDEAQKEERSLNFEDFNNFKLPENTIEPKKEKKNESADDLNNIFNDDDFNFGDDFNFDNLFEDEKQTTTTKAIEQKEPTEEPVIEKPTETQAIETVPVAVSETPEVTTIDKETESALLEEIRALRKELEEQKALYEELKAQARQNEEKWKNEKEDLEKLFSQHEIIEEEKSVPLLSLEEYENRLEVLRARLKANEKELKLNKKEFLPLKRVRKNLDNDKKKLRRREALVAKQKVMLYGVNNIMEIDQEKAKKLAENLDLLDGLKLSVRHCEEVMENNKDRYPILETTNRILITTNQDLKNDIAECEQAIAKLKDQNGIGDDSDGLIATANVALNSSAIKLEDVLVSVDGEEIVPKKRGRGRPKKQSTEESLPETSIDEPVIEEVIETQDTEKDENINKTEQNNIFDQFNLDDNQYFKDLVDSEENKDKPTDEE